MFGGVAIRCSDVSVPQSDPATWSAVLRASLPEERHLNDDVTMLEARERTFVLERAPLYVQKLHARQWREDTVYIAAAQDKSLIFN